jgi:cytoskeletal protein CcmA (bactofilin family)
MKFWIAVTIVAVLGVFGVRHTVHAAEYRTNDSVTVGSDEVIQDDLFVAGNNLQIDGVVEGDVYIAGQQIIVNGQINGDLIAAGSTITVNGDIGGSIRATGQNLNISDAEIGGGISFFGASLSLSSDSSVGKGLVFFGESVTVNGVVKHGITGFSSHVSLSGTIGTNSRVSAETIRIHNDAVIAGDFEYRSNQDLVLADKASVAGEIVRTGDLEQFTIDWRAGQFAFTLWSYVAALLVGAVLLLVARRPLKDAANVIRTRPFQSLGLGLLSMILVFPLGLLLLATIIGAPLAILLWLTFGVALYLSKFLVGIALGWVIMSRFTDKKTPPRLFISLFVGLSAIYVLNIISIITVLTSLMVGSLGLGAVVQRAYSGIRSQYATSAKK